MPTPRPRAVVLLPAVLVVLGAPALPAQSGPLFPEPFRVEHHLVHEEADGSRFVEDPVVDSYGGSWIVSERLDGSRLIVDLARREVTEVHPGKGTYWVVSFDRLGELMERAAERQGLVEKPAGDAAKAAASEPEIVVRELPAGSAPPAAKTQAAEAATRPGVRRFEVSVAGRPETAVELWIDPSIRLPGAAEAAIADFETELAATSRRTPDLVAAARQAAGGGFTVRKAQPVVDPATQATLGRLEDVATRVERLESLPAALVTVPEGLQRISHPLEVAVRFLDEHEALRQQMLGVESER